MSGKSFFGLILLLLVPFLLAEAFDRRERPEIAPAIPSADRSAGNRVFLERADILRKEPTDSFMVLVGDVVFTKGPMIMRCDSAHYFSETESMPMNCATAALTRLPVFMPTPARKCG